MHTECLIDFTARPSSRANPMTWGGWGGHAGATHTDGRGEKEPDVDEREVDLRPVTLALTWKPRLPGRRRRNQGPPALRVRHLHTACDSEKSGGHINADKARLLTGQTGGHREDREDQRYGMIHSSTIWRGRWKPRFRSWSVYRGKLIKCYNGALCRRTQEKCQRRRVVCQPSKRQWACA